MANLPHITEAAFTSQVLAYAKLHRWRCLHLRPARTVQGWRTAVQGDGVGWPDLFLCGTRALAAELKVGKRLPTAAQRDWLNALWGTGIETYLWTPDSWPEIERVLSEDTP